MSSLIRLSRSLNADQVSDFTYTLVADRFCAGTAGRSAGSGGARRRKRREATRAADVSMRFTAATFWFDSIRTRHRFRAVRRRFSRMRTSLAT